MLGCKIVAPIWLPRELARIWASNQHSLTLVATTDLSSLRSANPTAHAALRQLRKFALLAQREHFASKNGKRRESRWRSGAKPKEKSKKKSMVVDHALLFGVIVRKCNFFYLRSFAQFLNNILISHIIFQAFISGLTCKSTQHIVSCFFIP